MLALSTRCLYPRSAPGPSSSCDFTAHHISGIALVAVGRSDALCFRALCSSCVFWILTLEDGVAIPVKFGFLLAAAGVFLVRVSTCSMGHFSSLQVGISGTSFVFEEGWFLIAAEAVAACLESYLAAAAMVGFISLVKELAFMMLLPVPEAAAAWELSCVSLFGSCDFGNPLISE